MYYIPTELPCKLVIQGLWWHCKLRVCGKTEASESRELLRIVSLLCCGVRFHLLNLVEDLPKGIAYVKSVSIAVVLIGADIRVTCLLIPCTHLGS